MDFNKTVINMNSNDLIENAANVADEDAYRVWERRCDECLRSLRERCRVGPTITGTVSSIVAQIARLEGARYELRRRFVHVGAGHGDGRAYSWVEIETAFDRRVMTGAVINSRHVDPREFLNEVKDTVLEKVRDALDVHTCLKVNTVFNGEFVANGETSVKSIVTKNRQLFGATDLEEWYDEHVVETTLTDLEEFQERDSGWALLRILNLLVNINKCNPMRVGCWMEMPRFIRLRRAVVNVRSEDSACFAWSVVAALYPVDKHNYRSNMYPDFRTVLKLDGIDFPMTMRQISRFERLNDISVNVFTVKKRNAIVPLRLTDDKKNVHVNLLYMTHPLRGSNDGHFAWIKNLSRLVGSQLSRHRQKKHICDR